AEGFGQTTFTAFTLAGAQEHVVRQPGKISSVLIRATPGTTADELRARVAQALPAGMDAITGTQLAADRISDIDRVFLDRLRTFLVVFAGIALVVATLSINNTFTIT